jgi:hypothetical protein
MSEDQLAAIRAAREACVSEQEVANGEGPAAPMDLAAILDRTEAFYRRYVAMTDAQFVAVTLWTAHAHALPATDTTAYLHYTSPEPECGKSRAMECNEALCPSPLFSASMTTAVLFRAIQLRKPTLLIDEVDNQLRDRDSKSEMFGVLNAGYRRGAFALRMGGGNRDKLESFETFCAKAIGGLDDLLASLASRCLRIEMQRRRAGEHIEDFFREEAHAEAKPIREALAAWAETAIEELRASRPKRLGVRDRQEESFRLLLAIGDMAGEPWRTRTRTALLDLAGTSKNGATSEGSQLLSDIREVFSDQDADHITTADLLAALIQVAEAPWRGWWGVEVREGEFHPSKGAPSKLAGKLRAFKIKSTDIGPEDKRLKGFTKAQFVEAWERYLPDDPPDPDLNPRIPRIPRGRAKNEPSQSAQHDPACADMDSAQTRMVEPNARDARDGAGGGEDRIDVAGLEDMARTFEKECAEGDREGVLVTQALARHNGAPS